MTRAASIRRRRQPAEEIEAQPPDSSGWTGRRARRPAPARREPARRGRPAARQPSGRRGEPEGVGEVRQPGASSRQAGVGLDLVPAGAAAPARCRGTPHPAARAREAGGGLGSRRRLAEEWRRGRCRASAGRARTRSASAARRAGASSAASAAPRRAHAGQHEARRARDVVRAGGERGAAPARASRRAPRRVAVPVGHHQHLGARSQHALGRRHLGAGGRDRHGVPSASASA